MASNLRVDTHEPFAPSRALAGLLVLITIVCTGCSEEPVTAQITPRPARESVVGKVILFNNQGNSEEYRTSGWSKTEEQFTWSEGTSAKLQLPVGTDTGALTLRARLAGFTNAPELAKQPVEVYANGTKIADWEVGDTTELQATIPAKVAAADPELDLELRTPKALSPKSTGKSEDTRVLGIAVYELQLTRAQQ